MRLLAAGAAVILGLETAARLYCFGGAAFSYRRVESFHSIGRSGLLRASADPELGVELRPDLDTFFKLTRFTTNSHGYRDREHTLAKPAGTFRVVVVGASYVMGSGAEWADTLSSVLERRLAGSRPGTTYEVVTLAVGGHSPWQSAALVEKRALAYEPDLIVFGTSPGLYGRRRPPSSPEPVSHPFFHSYAARLLEAGLAKARRHRRGPEAPDPAAPARARPNIDDVFARLARVQQARATPVCVAALEHRRAGIEIVPELEASARAHDLPFVDATAPFAGAGHPNPCTHPLDCHPNAWAHEQFAASIHDVLVRRRLLDGGPSRALRAP